MNINGTKTLYDRTSTANAIYIGEAGCGVGTDKAQWAIRKIELDADGKPTAIKWAEGTSSAVNEWDDRTTLQYS